MFDVLDALIKGYIYMNKIHVHVLQKFFHFYVITSARNCIGNSINT